MDEADIGIEIITVSFRDIALTAVQSFTESTKESSWQDSLFRILRQKFENWRKNSFECPRDVKVMAYPRIVMCWRRWLIISSVTANIDLAKNALSSRTCLLG